MNYPAWQLAPTDTAAPTALAGAGFGALLARVLAARGYTDDQIQKTMVALKDSAAFGRQSAYTIGEAVQTATEGLKNENSILVNFYQPLRGVIHGGITLRRVRPTRHSLNRARD